MLVAVVAILACSFAGAMLAHAQPSTVQSAAERLSQPGPEDQCLAAETGLWDVVATLRPTPDAEPVVSEGLVAERTMIGNYQQEVMQPAPDSDAQDFRRLAYLHYFRAEGCWQYVSMDTRFPVGIMPAKGCEKPQGGKLTLTFDSLPFVGLGTEAEGRTINSNLEIGHDGPDHEFVRQYWTCADGTGRRWLAVEYEYTRRAATAMSGISTHRNWRQTGGRSNSGTGCILREAGRPLASRRCAGNTVSNAIALISRVLLPA
ncbi:MAG TPA: hypothetical protein VF200_08010 [Woeseiaceae bacterium]